jgi:hypothetical protein
MNFLINIVAKIGGVARLWGVLDGQKTRISGVASLLSGLAGIVGQLVPLIEAKDAALFVTFFTSLPANPAWLLLVGGLGILGVGHKLEKAAAEEAPKP